MITSETKKELLKKYGASPKDSGGIEFQIALLTERIKFLTEHLKKHKKDKSSKRGLLKRVGQRNRLLKYLKRKKPESYQKLIKELGLRK